MNTKLKMRAYRVLKNAYAPYSNFPVGCSLTSLTGKVYTGTNVENASYGGTICAERGAIMAGVAGEGAAFKIKEIVIVSEKASTLPPCALCLQVINEFSLPETKVTFLMQGEFVTKSLKELLPFQFIKEHLL